MCPFSIIITLHFCLCPVWLLVALVFRKSPIINLSHSYSSLSLLLFPYRYALNQEGAREPCTFEGCIARFPSQTTLKRVGKNQGLAPSGVDLLRQRADSQSAPSSPASGPWRSRCIYSR